MREPASIRYKNPGAMWGSALAIKWGADPRPVSLNDGTGQNNNIAVFPTYTQGICAQLDLWRTSKRYRNKRFSEAIAVWSGGNHVESYIKFVCDRVPGITRDTVLNDQFWLGPMGIPFLKAQAWHEAGKPFPAPAEDWIEARRRVFANEKPAEPPRVEPPPAAEPPPPPDIEPVEVPEVPAAAEGFFYRARVKIAGWFSAIGGSGIFMYLTEPKVWIVIGVFMFTVALFCFVICLWLFGKDRVRDWIARNIFMVKS